MTGVNEALEKMEGSVVVVVLVVEAFFVAVGVVCVVNCYLPHRRLVLFL